jgi:glutaconate CoA-transferase subunit B
MTAAFTTHDILISVIAGLLDGCRHVIAGASSPIPGTACLLASRRSGGRMRVTVLGSNRFNAFTNGGVETFDMAAQGRVDAFFLSGGQIDGEANINLVGVGDYPQMKVRWPGSFGSAYLYYLVPRVILFREEHTRRVMVDKVDFVSAPGWSPPGVHRPGGPHALVSPLGFFRFERGQRRFRLVSIHPGHTLEEILDNTGFTFDYAPDTPTTVAPDTAMLAAIRDAVVNGIAETYPVFGQEYLASHGG